MRFFPVFYLLSFRGLHTTVKTRKTLLNVKPPIPLPYDDEHPPYPMPYDEYQEYLKDLRSKKAQEDLRTQAQDLLRYKEVEVCKETVKFIQNSEVPICSNCVYFLSLNKKRPLLPLSNYEFLNARCTKFGKKDVVTGEFKPIFASLCREYKHLCGIEGKYFELKNASLRLCTDKSPTTSGFIGDKGNCSHALDTEEKRESLKEVITGYLPKGETAKLLKSLLLSISLFAVLHLCTFILLKIL